MFKTGGTFPSNNWSRVLDAGRHLSTGTEMGQTRPAFWTEFALAIDSPYANAIFLSCGGIRTLDAVEEIGAAAGKPVITSNQSRSWSCLPAQESPTKSQASANYFRTPAVAGA